MKATLQRAKKWGIAAGIAVFFAGIAAAVWVEYFKIPLRSVSDDLPKAVVSVPNYAQRKAEGEDSVPSLPEEGADESYQEAQDVLEGKGDNAQSRFDVGKRSIVWMMKGVGSQVSEEEMRAMRQAGITIIGTEWGIGREEEMQVFLDRAQRAGLLVVGDGGFSEAAWKRKGDEVVFQREKVQQFVRRFFRHPALFGWDISNEAGENFSFSRFHNCSRSSGCGILSVSDLREVRAAVREIDPVHPILVRMHYWDEWDDPFGEGNPFAAGIADIVMLNIYSNYSADGKTRALPRMVEDHAPRHVAAITEEDPSVEVWISIAAFAEDLPGDPVFLSPSPADLERDIVAACALPVSGIGFYQWGPEKYVDPLWYLPRDGERLWDVIRKHVKKGCEYDTIRL